MSEETKDPVLYLMDGSNYMYRAFFAIRDLSNSKGFPTNAIYGFTSMLLKLIKDFSPTYIAAAFDLKGPTFRHEAYEHYKATRKATPDDLVSQIPFIKEIIRAFSIPILEIQGVEADDILGTLARRYEERGLRTVIVSGDKDLMQLVSDQITMIDTMKDKHYDIAAVQEKFGVPPEKVVEILGLMGDSSDNIPGVPGIGAKTAQRLIAEYGSIEALIANVDRLRNAGVKKSLREFTDQARMSRDLAVIRTDVNVDFDLEASRYRGFDRQALKKLFVEFEFTTLLRDLDIRDEDLEGQYQAVPSGAELDDLSKKLRHLSAFSLEAVLTSEEPMRGDMIGLAIGTKPGAALYVPFADPSLILKTLGPILSDPGILKHGHDLKNVLIALAQRGVALQGLGCDTMVAAYILNPTRRSFDLADVAEEYLGQQVPSLKSLVGSGTRALPVEEVSLADMTAYACRRADGIMRLTAAVEEKIDKEKFGSLFRDVEMPLVVVLAAMEQHGVLLDSKLLRSMSEETAELLSLSEEKIYHLGGEHFNINSPKQLQVILFERLGLPKGKKTKEGYSTDVDVLTALARTYELPAEILAYRSLMKLKTTYIDSLPALIHPETGRIHTSYNQTVTATGRLSSSNPNLQNIPIRTLEGKRIRQAFIAPKGCILVSADYSQIELRILAHLSGDVTLIEAFNSGEDIHSRTASNIFGVFPEMVNEEMRRQAKVINFGVLYGMSAFGLSRELGINQKLAQAYIDGYFEKYAGVRRYLDGILEAARKDGYVTTLLGRRRFLPDINHSNAAVRQFAERMAVNTPIQGTAADLIKVAMVSIFKKLPELKLSSAMIMQVHDELVFEVPVDEKDEVMALVQSNMENVIRLLVPLKVGIAFGRNWDEAH
ncbi:MAG: DNA polymerase I [Syntrophales bacterium]|jgi:DNA polymerase-1